MHTSITVSGVGTQSTTWATTLVGMLIIGTISGFYRGSHFTAGCAGGGIMEESPVLDPERLDLTTTSVVKTDCSQVSCYSIIIHHDTGIDHEQL